MLHKPANPWHKDSEHLISPFHAYQYFFRHSEQNRNGQDWRGVLK